MLADRARTCDGASAPATASRLSSNATHRAGDIERGQHARMQFAEAAEHGLWPLPHRRRPARMVEAGRVVGELSASSRHADGGQDGPEVGFGVHRIVPGATGASQLRGVRAGAHPAATSAGRLRASVSECGADLEQRRHRDSRARRCAWLPAPASRSGVGRSWSRSAAMGWSGAAHRACRRTARRAFSRHEAEGDALGQALARRACGGRVAARAWRGVACGSGTGEARGNETGGTASRPRRRSTSSTRSHSGSISAQPSAALARPRDRGPRWIERDPARRCRCARTGTET